MAKTKRVKLEFDHLQLYFGEPYVIKMPDSDKAITVLQPTIGDIIAMGEQKFYGTLNIFITNTTAYRLPLWDMGIDWNEISDFELFTMLYKGIDKDVSDLLFDNIDFSKFELFTKQLDEEVELVLYDQESDLMIDKDIYNQIAEYFREVFKMEPEEKYTTDKTMKEWFIRKDRRQLEIQNKKKKDEKKSSLQAVISACVNHPGFKYKLKELKEVGVCEFYDSVKRLQIYESTTALMKGMYSGFVDGSKMKPDDYNFMKEL